MGFIPVVVLCALKRHAGSRHEARRPVGLAESCAFGDFGSFCALRRRADKRTFLGRRNRWEIIKRLFTTNETYSDARQTG